MQFKTAILLSVVAAVSTTTLAAPVHRYELALSRPEGNIDIPYRHHARDLEETQEIEARSPFSDEQELEARGFLDFLNRVTQIGMRNNPKPSAAVQAARDRARGRTIRRPRSLPEEIEARSPTYELDDIDA